MKAVRRYPLDFPRTAALSLAAIGAGLLNGFFGTGGGMVLVITLSHLLPKDRRKEAFVYSSVGVFGFCLVSLFLYNARGLLPNAALSNYALAALVGGAVGAFLFGRLGTRLLRKIFAVLLLYSGLKMMGVL